MKVLVTGFKGQLGFDVCRELTSLGIENQGVDIADFDLTDKQQTKKAIIAYHPDVVVHCAAYTAVDKAETNRELCYAVNVLGTAHVAEACREIDATMVYISTDYVFDGLGETPFEIDTAKAPLNYYGETKALGEDEVASRLIKYFIVRISWAFGVSGNNFVKIMMRLGSEKENIRVVSDQIGSPTNTADLAKLLCQMIQTKKYGIYHATNEGYCSWYEFAKVIMREAGLKCCVEPILTNEYPTLARRPQNSRLSKASLDLGGFDHLPNWQDALKRYLNALN